MCAITERAPWISNVRRYTSPRLLIPPIFTLPPVPSWRGTMPSQAGTCRAFLKFFVSPSVATNALAVRGPMPAIASSLQLASFSRCQSLICSSSSPTCRYRSFKFSSSRCSNSRIIPGRAFSPSQDLGQPFGNVTDALGNHDPELGEQASHLIGLRGTCLHEPLAGSMQCQHRLHRRRLDVDFILHLLQLDFAFGGLRSSRRVTHPLAQLSLLAFVNGDPVWRSRVELT